jgi:protein-S-isoprenylcysteine O-methyltransferase Ste14
MEMFTILLQVLGACTFVGGTFVLGKSLRKNPEREFAERRSRIGHFLIYGCLVFPATLGIFYPGLTRLDGVIGIGNLPFRKISLPLGYLLLLAGLSLMYAAHRGLTYRGQGAPAFKLTKKLVVGGIHRRIRNPMSLGFYLTCLGISLAAGSTYCTLGTLLVLVPAHLFYLMYFEECELEIRFGETYRAYKKNVPFMIPKVW